MWIRTVLRHLLRPARGGAAAVVGVFVVGLSIAAMAGWLGIPLALILLSWYFKYAYILFDHTVRGFDEPPVLDIQMVNPLDEQRPVAQVIIVCLIAMLRGWLAARAPPAVADGVGLAVLFLLPASICELALEGNPFAAVNPLALLRMIRGLGGLYLLAIGVAFAYALLLEGLWRWNVWQPVQLAAGMFTTLSMFSLLAGLMYERRLRLGLDTWKSPERQAAKEAARELQESERLLTEAYGMARAGAHGKAAEAIRSWLSTRGNSAADYRWLCEKVASWGDARYVTRYTEEFVEKLLMLGQKSDALNVVAKRVAVDARFRPSSARSTLMVAQLAAIGGGQPKLARILLADFSERFPDDPHGEAARALARSLAT